MKTEVFRMERVTYKEHENVKLEDFNLHVFKGEILGLIPVNLHGLTSFLKLLKTNYPLYDGYIYYNEITVNSWRNTVQSDNKVTIIQNKSCLVEGLTVADNVFVLRNGFRSEYIQQNILQQQLQPFLDEIGLNIKASVHVGKLSVFERIIVELLKGIIAAHKLIILNEIETLITGQELKLLHKILKYYSQKGYTFIYICLHAEDIVQLCDRAVLLRNGRIEKTLLPHELSVEKLIPITKDYSRLVRGYVDKKGHSEEAKTKFFELSYNFKDSDTVLDLSIMESECIVIHCQNTQMYYEIKAAILEDKLGEGNLRNKEGLPERIRGNKEVALIQELAAETMLFPQLSYIDNLCFNLDRRMRSVWLRRNVKTSVQMEYGAILGKDVFNMSIDDLSEKQKYSLVYSRILLQRPKMVFCIQPFQGADLEHRIHIWKLLESLLEKGISIVILSVNLSDTLSIADRLIQIDEEKQQTVYERKDFVNISSIAPWKQLY